VHLGSHCPCGMNSNFHLLLQAFTCCWFPNAKKLGTIVRNEKQWGQANNQTCNLLINLKLYSVIMHNKEVFCGNCAAFKIGK
jgi:hypothetical protein